MSEITRVGVDLAKRVIQVHAVDAAGRVVAAKALAREKFAPWCAQLPPGCLVAMESCSGAHHWARKLCSVGLDARLIAAHLVTPYRMRGRGGKNDANDAAAVCEAASRPSMRFVPVKSVEQQSLLSIHRLGEGYKEERTACINRIRGRAHSVPREYVQHRAQHLGAFAEHQAVLGQHASDTVDA